MTRQHYDIRGQVQGVGFRPFIYNLALSLKLVGFIKNTNFGVEIEIEGDKSNVKKFILSLHIQLPPLAKIDSIKERNIKPILETNFKILKSTNNFLFKTAFVPPDIQVCNQCLDDMKIISKYEDYFATNCTNCGPRYSIIKDLPYDRQNSSMLEFEMCESCKNEYNDLTNRRFHAQPISCNYCGPKLILTNKNITLNIKKNKIYQKIVSLINEGNILAIKSLGGFHIVCNATNNDAIKKLRKYKNRPTKPFAIICKNINQIKKFAFINNKEKEILNSKEAPIVILQKLSNFNNYLSDIISPDIDKIGCFLPYTPLYHLLFKYLKTPVIATSANLANEPIIFNKEDIYKKLDFIDYVLDFNRDIVNAIDDSLVQVINDKKQILRLARGYAPKTIKVPFTCQKKILSIGANQKNSIALAFEDNIILSPYIGDLDNVKTFDFFIRTIETFKRFYNFKPDLIIHDKHPNYLTTKWASEQNIPTIQVQHHLAHIYACKAEYNLTKDCTGFSFDGTGYGDDGTIWGGEVFIGNKRKYHFKPIKLLGSAKAIKEPRRVALSMLFDKLDLNRTLNLDNPAVLSFSQNEIKLLYQSYSKDINSPLCSSVGRLFDGVASLCGVIHKTSYEGESGLLCESLYNKEISKSFFYTIEDEIIDLHIIDYILKNQLDKIEFISMFINSLVEIIVDISKFEKLDVICSGGVFQNKTLLELVLKELKKEKINCYFQQDTPINDGGIALGQIFYILQNNIKGDGYV